MTVKAITLWQPWASAIALGYKRYETRSWKGPDSLIGQALAIHAAARKPDEVIPGLPIEALPLGKVLCIVTVLGYRRTEEFEGMQMPTEKSWGDFSHGRWAWHLRFGYTIDPPAPAKGAQGIWDWKVEATQ